MGRARTLLLAGLVFIAPLGCTSLVTGTAVRGAVAPKDGVAGCTPVSAPLTTIAPRSPGEAVLKIPELAGWQRTDRFDSPLIRYLSADRDLTENDFSPTVTVTLESGPATAGDEAHALDQERAGLVSVLGAADLTTTSTTLCGHRADLISYTAPPMGQIPARKAQTLSVAATFTGQLYVTTVTVQTTNPDDPTYSHDVNAILTGFQILPPDAR